MLPPVKREGIKTFYWHTNSPSMRIKKEIWKDEYTKYYTGGIDGRKWTVL
jgi:hypothetical protein